MTGEGGNVWDGNGDVAWCERCKTATSNGLVADEEIYWKMLLKARVGISLLDTQHLLAVVLRALRYKGADPVLDSIG